MSPDPEHSHPEEHPTKRAERWARIRRVKQMLKYMPRRAVMHKYPIVGRFAEMARKRAYLWSMKPEAMRPAFYAGSILSLLPVMGAQIPLALVLSLVLRANFMVMGGLQFITNPVTFFIIYPATYQLGASVLYHSGWGPVESVPAIKEPVMIPDTYISPSTSENGGNLLSELAAKLRVENVTHLVNSLIIGGVISGLTLGLLLDILYRNYWQHHTNPRPRGRRGLLPPTDGPPAPPAA